MTDVNRSDPCPARRPRRDRIRVGIIGAGHWTRAAHLPALMQLPNVAIAAIADPSDTARRLTAASFTGEAPRWYRDGAEMLDTEALDAAVISTPHSTHFPLAAASLHRGVPVLVDKPLAGSSDEAEALVALARSKDIYLGVGYQRRYRGRYIAMRRYARRSASLHAITASLVQPWAASVARGGSWRADPAAALGGALTDTGRHLIDIVLWMVGKDPDALTASLRFDSSVEVDAYITMDFGSDLRCSLAMIGSAAIGQWHEDVTLWGREAMRLQDKHLVRLSQSGKAVLVDRLPADTSPEAHFIGNLSQGYNQEVEQEITVARVIELARVANETGQRQVLPAGAQRLPLDATQAV